MKRFSTRLTTSAMLVFAVIIVAITVFFYNYTQSKLREEVLRRANYALDNMENKVDRVLTTTLEMMTVFGDKIGHQLDAPETISGILSDVVELAPGVTSSVVAYKPGEAPLNSHLLTILVREERDSIETFLMNGEQLDYTEKDWFQKPMTTGKESWTDLIVTKTDKSQSLISLSRPILDDSGRVRAVFMAKISLNWLFEAINENPMFGNSIDILTNGDEWIFFGNNNSTISEEDFVDMIWDTNNRLKTRWSLNACETLLESHNVLVTKYLDHYYFTFSFDMPIAGWKMLFVSSSVDVFRDFRQTAVISGLVGLVGLIVVYLLLSRSIKRQTLPLTKLSESARRIAIGDFQTPIPQINSGDETQELGESFRHMRDSLLDYMEELKRTTIAKQRIESELAIARSIQMGMVPKVFPPFPERSDLDIYAVMRPAREVGGDLYDYFIQEERFFFIIGDVSGKGIPASLFMAVIRSLFRSIAHQERTPDAIVRRINSSVLDTNTQDGMFVTLVVGILDLRSGGLAFCDAGHNPFIRKDGTGTSFVKMLPNIPVAVLNDFPYKTEYMDLKGTTLFLYTDGVTEAENENQELYGNQRLLKTVAETSEVTSAGLMRHVTDSVERFVGNAEQSDDLTVLAIRYLR